MFSEKVFKLLLRASLTIHKRMKNKVQDLEIDMEGALIPEQAEKIRVIQAHYDALAICKEDLEQMIRELGQDY